MKYIVAVLISLSSIASVYAVYISEIMYDPQGSDTSREWIEIYNDTSGAIDFTVWKFFESGTNHGMTSYSGGSTVISGGYGIIVDNPVKFLADFPSFQGVLYDSSFSLSNTGEQLILKDGGGNSIDTFTYSVSVGGNDDGTTLSKINSTWEKGDATPGNSNQITTSSNVTTTATTTGNQTTIAQMSPPLPDIVLYLPFEKTVVAGAESEFAVYGMTRTGKPIENLSYTWAFGDGGKGYGTSTLYRYAYPGRYVAHVEGGNGYVIGTGRISVHVVPPDIIISKVENGKYGTFVDITNPNRYALDLSQWKLTINGSSFSFPKNTIILGNTTTHISGVAMGFASTTLSSNSLVQILFPNLEEVTRFTFSEEVATKSVASSSNMYTPKPIKVIKKQAQATVQEKATTTRTFSQQKDTRIVTFFKSFFRK